MKEKLSYTKPEWAREELTKAPGEYTEPENVLHPFTPSGLTVEEQKKKLSAFAKQVMGRGPRRDPNWIQKHIDKEYENMKIFKILLQLSPDSDRTVCALEISTNSEGPLNWSLNNAENMRPIAVGTWGGYGYFNITAEPKTVEQIKQPLLEFFDNIDAKLNEE